MTGTVNRVQPMVDDVPIHENGSELQELILNCAKYQSRPRPNHWTNNVVDKLARIGVTTVDELQELTDSDGLNDRINTSGRLSRFHPTTITVFKKRLERGIDFDGTYFDERAQDFYTGDW